MDDMLKTLDAHLEAIRGGVAAKRGSAHEPWHDNAISTVLGNVDAYRRGIADAAATASPDAEAQAACRIAGIRKGIGDLGILDPVEDRRLIATIDETDMLATETCVRLRAAARAKG